MRRNRRFLTQELLNEQIKMHYGVDFCGLVNAFKFGGFDHGYVHFENGKVKYGFWY